MILEDLKMVSTPIMIKLKPIQTKKLVANSEKNSWFISKNFEIRTKMREDEEENENTNLVKQVILISKSRTFVFFAY